MRSTTWRPRKTRITAYALAGLIMATMIWLAVVISDTFQLADRIGIVLFGVFVAVLLALLARVKVVADGTGLTVVNPLRTHRYAWAEIVGVGLGEGAPWPYLDLADGTTKGLVGIQGSEGASARVAVAELRALIAERGETPDPS
ncbi:PH domain-containing protein [Actinocorallia sp. A-T 12471]|uniref:PH domain-containing protein n=1 Tax=Actinocorallia sp. A-T 12471 TaxID=3089813 RepID=UPI0029CEA3E5|nr:PH domain-containing protein [Actinocorallia sp. A-T 12471]MDX6743114.1 PH domain-containing protein [Actinocorallia sp. A-T 12471]